MTATVVSLESRRSPAPTCNCSKGFVCYPHRLVDLAARVEDVRADVQQIQFCDWSTFERLAHDVLEVIASITADCPTELPTTTAVKAEVTPMRDRARHLTDEPAELANAAREETP